MILHQKEIKGVAHTGDRSGRNTKWLSVHARICACCPGRGLQPLVSQTKTYGCPMCGPQSSSLCTTWEPVRNAESLSPNRIYWVRIYILTDLSCLIKHMCHQLPLVNVLKKEARRLAELQIFLFLCGISHIMRVSIPGQLREKGFHKDIMKSKMVSNRLTPTNSFSQRL